MVNLNWLDITAIVIILLFMLEGLVRGFVLTVFNTVGFIAAFIAARFLAPYCAGYIQKNTGIYNAISTYCINKVPASDKAYYAFKLMGAKTSLGDTIAGGLILMTAFAIIFIIAKMLLSALARVMNMVSHLPVLKQFNALGGLLFGLIKGVFLLYIVFAVLTPILPLLKPENPLIIAMEESSFAVNFYRYNLILMWLYKDT